MTGTEDVAHYDVTRISLIDALVVPPLTGYLNLEARGRLADAILGQLPAGAGVMVDPGDLRTLMLLAQDYATRDPLRLPPSDSCREALARLSAAAKVTGDA